MPTKPTTLAEFPVSLAEAVPDSISAQIATIVSLTADGTPEVRLGAAGPAVPARLAVRATRERIEAAIAERQQTVVIFEGGDPSKPLIVGFIEALESQSPEPFTDVHEPVRHAVDKAPSLGADVAAPVTRPDDSERAPFVEADVDGRRIRVTAQDEIVLQCGSASVTLRRNGRVVIRGTYVETQSEGTNRIKGGQVRIN